MKDDIWKIEVVGEVGEVIFSGWYMFYSGSFGAFMCFYLGCSNSRSASTVSLHLWIQYDLGLRLQGKWIQRHWSQGSIRAKSCLGFVSWALSTLDSPSKVTSDLDIQSNCAGSVGSQRFCLRLCLIFIHGEIAILVDIYCVWESRVSFMEFSLMSLDPWFWFQADFFMELPA